MEALIIKSAGSSYLARTYDDSIYDCRVKGRFRLKGIRTTNPVAVGDRVVISPISEQTAYITDILPRRNYIIRRASNLSKESHILAANLDAVMLIASLVHPTTSLTFIDRFLATAEAYAIPAALVLNKADLLDDEGLQLADAIQRLYTSIGYDVIRCSAIEGHGLDALRDFLKDRTTLLAGNSGVGKSTLVNDLIPDADVRTAPISDIHDQGVHTTTYSEMYMLPFGGAIIDTPGVRGFGTIDFDAAETSHYFPEIFAAGRECRYSNCTHVHEPGCAVLDAVASHRIAASRYASYLNILDDTKPSKYRAPY